MADALLVDPLGQPVELLEDTWVRHIVVGHPELASLRRWAERAITAPVAVTESANQATHPTGVQYYGACGRPGLYLMVATEEVIGGRRLVKTAHLVKRLGAGRQLWP